MNITFIFFHCYVCDFNIYLRFFYRYIYEGKSLFEGWFSFYHKFIMKILGNLYLFLLNPFGLCCIEDFWKQWREHSWFFFIPILILTIQAFIHCNVFFYFNCQVGAGFVVTAGSDYKGKVLAKKWNRCENPRWGNT